MPKIGDTIRTKQLGKNGTGLYVFTLCPKCSKGRWVRSDIARKLPLAICMKCNHEKTAKSNIGKKRSKEYIQKARESRLGSKSHFWKGGKFKVTGGYIGIKIYPGNKFHSMTTTKDKVLEHRYIMAKHLGRVLLPTEIVHHRDGNRQNNLIFNLQLFVENREHCSLHLKGKKRASFSKKWRRNMSKAQTLRRKNEMS